MTPPPVHPAFVDRGDPSEANREGLFHSFKEVNDYMSLPQSPCRVTFLHRQQFGLGLGGVNVLYAHYKTLTSLCMESHLNHVVDGTGGSTAYLCRGGRSSS